MPTLLEMRETRATVWDKMKELVERSDNWSAEDRSTYDAAEAELDKIGADIDLRERHEARAAVLDRVDRSLLPPAGGGDGGTLDAEEAEARSYELAFRSLLRANGMGDLEPEERTVLRGAVLGQKELRALGVSSGSAGGFTVPPGFRDKIVEIAKTFGGMLQVAQVINTDSGENLQWPTLDDTANVGAILAENTAAAQLDIVFTTASLNAFMYTSRMVLVSLQLLQDSAFDVEALLAKKLGERLGRILNLHFTTGTGSSQPLGIVTAASIGKTGANGQTTTVTYDDLIDLIDSIDPAYQAKAKFMLNQGSRRNVRKLKDLQGRPLWEPSLQTGTPDSLLGYGIALNQDMPAMAASAKSILFGDFEEAYVIRLVNGQNLVQFNERYMDSLQKGFMAYQRADGTMQNAAAVRAYANSAT